MSDEWEDYLQQPPTRREPATIHTTPRRDEMMPTMNLGDLKEGLKRVLPVIETIARITPNKYDDLAIAFLKQVLAVSDEQAAKMLAELK